MLTMCQKIDIMQVLTQCQNKKQQMIRKKKGLK